MKGSPPRMRGQVQHVRIQRFDQRITPADAGTSLRLHTFCPRYSDHPRGCGDKRWGTDITNFWNGSPPRMRGQAGIDLKLYIHPRITPADAGTRSLLLLLFWRF